MSFSKTILTWYQVHKRDLPWRISPEPYKVWLSEIMLQQTRVAQGLPYFQKFIDQYPTVCDLAHASEEEVLKLWQGLGYYSRARNLHHTAKTVCFEYDGVFPNTYEGLKKLKGVGPYTAAAIGSICFNLPTPVVDGNVYRLLSRYFGVEIPVNTGAGVTYFEQLAKEVMEAEQIGNYNQAVMEFGAVQCVPKSPDCAICPLAESCWAFAQKKVDILPIKQGRQKIRIRHFHYAVPLDSALRTFLFQRPETGIWSKLYEFPLLEKDTEGVPETSELLDALMGRLSLDNLPQIEIIRFNDAPIIHKLSHQHLHTTFWLCKMNTLPSAAISWDKAELLPVPVLIANFMETLKNSYF